MLPPNLTVRQRGFSLVELLVVLAIVGLLIALILPAIQQSRAAARRTACLNNLRQLGIAFHSYHDTHSLLPPAAIWGGPPGEPLGGGQLPIGLLDRVAMGAVSPGDPSRMHANWLVLMLPQLEQASLYNTYHSSLPVSAVENKTVREASLPILKCPDDTFNGTSYVRDGANGPGQNQYARGNYAMNFGPDRLCVTEADPENCKDGFHVDSIQLQTENYQLWGSGMGGYNKSFTFKDVTAGTSQMVIVDEIRAGPHSLDSRGAWALGFVGSSLTARHALADSQQEDSYGPNNQNGAADDVIGCGAVAAAAAEGAEFLTSHRMPCHSYASPETADQATARSLHTAGVHVLMCDGSAHFVADSVSLEVWRQMHQRNSKAAAALQF